MAKLGIKGSLEYLQVSAPLLTPCCITEYSISNLTVAMNTRYNATVFILQQEYIQIHMFTNVLLNILQKQLCLPITGLP